MVRKQHSPPSGLVRGDYSVSVAQLASFLRDAARHHARRAVECPHDADEFVLLDAAISVGTAVELIAKALIATVHPALLVKPSPRDTVHGILRLTEGRGLAGRGPYDFKTLDAAVAVELAKTLDVGPGMSVANALNVRNAAAHFGVAIQADFSVAVGEMTAYVDASLTKLNVSRNEFWQLATDAAQQALLLRRTRDRERVEALVDAARARYEAGIGNLPDDEAREKVIEQLVEGSHPGTDDSTEVECPGCGTDLQVGIEFEWDVGRDRGGWDAIPLGPALHDLDCPVCGLVLSQSEMEHAGLPVADMLGYVDENY
ncbi:hypothetical protein [Pseudactinotalea suaedae]|uniref:hypothetical protein n=1 Tax=Pseudactinotalea suaedae TaxID=1524924 RepID=UPI0012E1035C|nr:hypothetical protein [Pseudactinotalea suaedae]